MGRPKSVKMVKLVCNGCGTVFERRTSDVRICRSRGSKKNYHSRECYRRHQENIRDLRVLEIKKLRGKRLTFREIGQKLGLSAQRIYQITKGF